MARAIARSAPDPISEINITPLIDVMLVLLIVLILSIPVASHKVPLNLPQPGQPSPLKPEPHRLDMAANGSLLWDLKPIPDGALPGLLAAGQRSPTFELQMRVDPAARYERFDAVLAQIRRAGVERLGFLDQPRSF